MNVFGFGYSDPNAIATTLQSQFGKSFGLGPGQIRCFLKASSFVRELENLDGCTVFLFDRPDRLVKIEPINQVDFQIDGVLYRYRRFGPSNMNVDKVGKLGPVFINLAPRDIIREMLDASDDGILNGILTFIYTIKNTKVRKDVTEIVYPWFFTKTRQELLFDRLQSEFRNVDFTPLRTVFEEKRELVQGIRDAIRTYSLKKHPDFRAYCESKGVPFYDCHYLVKVVNPNKPKDPASVE